MRPRRLADRHWPAKLRPFSRRCRSARSGGAREGAAEGGRVGVLASDGEAIQPKRDTAVQVGDQLHLLLDDGEVEGGEAVLAAAPGGRSRRSRALARATALARSPASPSATA